MLAGQFPNYDLVLPKNNDKSITLNVDRITQAIRRAALMADERSHGVKVDLTNGKLSITSQSADVGEAKEMILWTTGDNLSIGFNAQYVLDFLGVVGTDEVVFEFRTNRVRRCCDHPGTANRIISMWSCRCDCSDPRATAQFT
jgi:DNA polymerase-3 subunit beta